MDLRSSVKSLCLARAEPIVSGTAWPSSTSSHPLTLPSPPLAVPISIPPP
ncbi:hypothetical protein SAY87_000248 [Trapa incisa]|uniref:Uncharacterized protein n=1 Tax=Trapa incisa TaxID=236973 RepID=A0AAN7GMY7_9MYRT|nr:hypothetical protein SAY87_000248 [Trapa incisa]